MCSQPELDVAVELTPCSVQGLYSTNLSEFLLRKITLCEVAASVVDRENGTPAVFLTEEAMFRKS
jgi:hypothetical protein